MLEPSISGSKYLPLGGALCQQISSGICDAGPRKSNNPDTGQFRARAMARSLSCGLVHPRARSLHYRRPFRDLGLDELAELLGRARREARALGRKASLDVG